MRKISVKEWVETLSKYGIESPESFSMLEESVTYGTNCLDLVLSEKPYVGLRFYYNNFDEYLIPVILRVMIKKKDCKLNKDVLKSILPSILAAEEDQDVMLLALKVPKFDSLDELLRQGLEVAKSLKEICGTGKEARLEGYVPTDCTKFIHVVTT